MALLRRSTMLVPKVYRDKNGKYRWRVRHPQNGKIVLASTEAYSRKIDAEDNYNLMLMIKMQDDCPPESPRE